MAQTKAQKKRAIEGKKYYVVYKKPTKSGKLGKDHVSKWLNYNDAIKYAKSKQDCNSSAKIIEKKSSIDHQHIGYIGLSGKFHEGV